MKEEVCIIIVDVFMKVVFTIIYQFLKCNWALLIDVWTIFIKI